MKQYLNYLLFIVRKSFLNPIKRLYPLNIMEFNCFVASKSCESNHFWFELRIAAILLFPFCSCSIMNNQQESTVYRFETLAGSSEGFANGKAEESLFCTPEGITVDSRGNIFTTEYWTTVVRKIAVDGTVSVLAGKGNEPGNINGPGNEARFNKPHGLVVVGDSAVYVCDMKSHTIRKVTYNGEVTTFAGIMGQQGIDDGFRLNAAFNQPEAIAVNSKGELYVADSYNFTIRKIALNGEVTTFAGKAGKAGYADGEGPQALFNKPLGIAIDAKDNIYIADSDYDGDGGNCLVRKITPKGKVSTLAGIPFKPGNVDGKPGVSLLDRPVGIAVTPGGIIFVADTEADLIRMIDKQGNVSTLGGKYLDENFADGTGLDACFADPQAIAVDKNGNLYIADTFNNRIRKGTKVGKK
jgi:sugar lactone lactonase YvrE